MTDEALALAFRTGMPYVGLRDHAHDPELDHLIPPDAARTARAIPLTADVDRIRLAVADPEPDLSALDPYLSGRQVHLALAPREELDKILGPPPVRVAEPDAGEAAADEGTEEEHEPAVAEPDSPPAPDAGPVGDEEEPTGEEDAAGPADPALASVAEAPLADGAEPAAPGLPAAEEPAGPVAAAAAAPPADDHPELAGEVPSWLEPRRRRWPVVLALIIVFLVLIAAAAAVYAYVVT